MLKIKLILHRGFSGLYPENTKLALEKAKELYEIEKSVVGVEFDIWPTKGSNKIGPFVIIHDANTFYLSNSKSFTPVYEMTVSQLKKYTYQSHQLNNRFSLKNHLLNINQYQRNCFRKRLRSSIMTLEEGLNLFDNKIKIIIELKGNLSSFVSYMNCLIKQLRPHREKNLYLKGKHKSFLLALKAKCPYLKVGLLINKTKHISYLKDSFDFMSIKYDLINKDIIKKLIKDNKEIMVWTINNNYYLKKLYHKAKGYFYYLNIITDNPDLLINYYQKLTR